MNRTICSVLLATVALVLVGCGASVDGGSGVFKNEADLAVTSSIDKTSVVPGTNLLQKMTLTNNGPRDATDAKLVFFGESQGSGWPVLFALPFELQANCSVNGVGELGEFEYVEGGFAVEASLSLEFGSSVECDVRVPVLYTNVLNTSPDMLEIITCAEEDPDNPDPDDSNDCATNEAAVESAQDIVDFRDEIIYWALTDRFNNGDPLNDDLPGTRTADAADPDNADGWHGGDFAGLKQKIEEGYFQSMGFTAIWISPVVFQVAPTFQNPAGDDFTAYHGYWLENFDDNEPHFGTWQELNALVQTAHDNDLKIIIDIVLNHTGEGAALVSSEPDWFREGAPACGNPAVDYVCEIAGNLPDLRQENEEARQWLLDGARNILLQSGADGFRIDTYKHVNPDFWYDFFAPGGPGDRSTVFSMGESFTDAIVRVAQALDWDGAPYMFDFPLRDATTDSLARRSSSTDNVAAVLDTDNLYLDPTRLVTFLDNHDVDRFMTEAISGGASESEAEERLDMALGLQYGVRGVPQVYYGTELAYQGTESPLRSNRKDMTFPNGALARLASLNKAGPGLSQKVTCGVTGTGDPAEAYGVPIFARGGFNDWGAVPAAEFQNLGSVVYQAEFPIAAGTWEFKVADADWAVVDFTADGVVNLGEPVTLVPGSGASNSTITIVADGCYNFALDVTDTAAPVLTITQVTLSKTTCGVTGTGDPAEAYGVPIFARGGFNDWGAVPAAEFQNLGSVVYQAEFP
ncbi:MAG: alpha-amylase family glycosyl hydrolase, partial [Chromatiales bacterium]|nr:alpha-amylase family glycosyl hydrolase [Chromatiales bacterium]